jgi:hypothetical protein
MKKKVTTDSEPLYKVKTINNIIKFSILLITLISLSQANEYPNHWPWRGVNVPVDVIENENGIFQELSNININAIRINTDYGELMKSHHLDPDQASDYSIEQIDKLLNETAKHNMTTMIGIESFPLKGQECQSKLKPVFWKTQSCIDQMYQFANKLTLHFRSRGDELVAYQFISEPVVLINNNAELPKNWGEIQNKLLSIVEKNDPQRFFVYSAGVWGFANGYKNYKPLLGHKIIYDAHGFNPHPYTHQGIGTERFDVKYPGWINLQYWDKQKLEGSFSDLKNFQKKYDVPILIAGFSKMNWINDDNQWLKDSIDIYEKNNWSWLYFSVGDHPWHGWDPRYEGYYNIGKFVYHGDTKTWKTLKTYLSKNKKATKK